MNKHTPGPWRIHRDSKGRGFELYGGDGKEVCRINARRSGSKRGQQVMYCLEPADEANARLIAAAPELLAACQQMMKWLDELRAVAFDHCAPNGEPDDTMTNWIIDAQPEQFGMESARAAIAKAEGRSE